VRPSQTPKAETTIKAIVAPIQTGKAEKLFASPMKKIYVLSPNSATKINRKVVTKILSFGGSITSSVSSLIWLNKIRRPKLRKKTQQALQLFFLVPIQQHFHRIKQPKCLESINVLMVINGIS